MQQLTQPGGRHTLGELSEVPIHCPYCGELIEVVVEILDEDQEYIEDCQVCCRPIVVTVSVAIDGHASISVRAEHES